ncbi:serine/threonine protein kinase [Cyanobacteria bacterium FACHB-63]|nr:serine/threonine protein kinase [Cyanobacteria bacterium FACHB-63]
MLHKIIDGRYKILKPLSSGAFGQTYLAKNLTLPNEPLCVVKQLKLQAEALFNCEVEVLHQIGYHDRIPQILDSFKADYEFYLVQEYIEGKTLREEFESQSIWHESQAVSFLQEMLQILEFVHTQGIVHRDIKPENIIRRTQDQVLFLIDFGAVKRLWLDREQISSAIVRSGGYTPPEQLDGISEPNSDLYATGMTCIEALTGVKPESLTQLRNTDTRQIIWSEHLSIRAEFKSILSKMVCIDARNRYVSASDVLQDLELLKQTGSTQYTPTEFRISCKNTVKQSETSQAYTPTELRIDCSTNACLYSLGEEFDQQLDILKPARTRSKELSSKELLLKLNECFQNEQKSLRPRTAINITHQLLSKKRLILFGLLAFMGLLLFSISIYKNTHKTSLASDSSNYATNNTEPLVPLKEKANIQEHTSSIKSLNFTRDGKILISSGEGGLVKLRDLQSQSVKTLTQTQSQILAVASSANGKTLAIATENKQIEIWNFDKQQKLNQISTQQLTWSLALSHDGQLLAESGLGIVRLWKVHPQLKPLKKPQFYENSQPIQAITFNAATEILVGGDANGAVKISNLAFNTSRTFHKHSKTVNSMAIDANNTVLFTGSEDDTIRIWNLYALNEHTLPVIQAGLSGVNAIASSPTERIIAAGGSYGTVKLWNWHTGQLLANFSNHSTEVTSLAFSPDGQRLAIGDVEGRIAIYALK